MTAVELPSKASQGGPFGTQHRVLSVGIFGLILCVAFEFMAVATALPVAARDLGGLDLFPWALSAFLAAAMFANGVAGEVSDRVGPRLPILLGSTMFTAGLLVSGLSTSMPILICGRVVQGLGAGFTIVGVYVVIGQCYPDQLRPQVMSLLSTAWVVPSVVGPFIAGGLTELISWRWAFLMLVPLTPLPLLLVLPRIQPTPASGARRSARVLLAAMMAIGAALLQWSGLEAEHQRWVSAVAAVCLGATFVVLAASRLFPPGTLRLGRGLPSVVAFRGVIAGGFFGCEAYVPLMLVEHRGASPTMAGLAVACTAGGWSAGSAWQGRPGLGMRRSGLVRLGSAVTAVGVLVASSAAIDTETVTVPAWVAAVGLLVGGLGMGLSMSSNAVLLLDYSPPSERGANSAALQMSDSLGGVLVIGGAGVLYSALRTTVSASELFGAVFTVAFLVTVLAAGVSVRVRTAAFPSS